MKGNNEVRTAGLPDSLEESGCEEGSEMQLELDSSAGV